MFLAASDPEMGILAGELAANADFKFQLDAIQFLTTGVKGPTGSLLKVFSSYELGGGPWGGVNGYTPVCPGFLGCVSLFVSPSSQASDKEAEDSTSELDKWLSKMGFYPPAELKMAEGGLLQRGYAKR